MSEGESSSRDWKTDWIRDQLKHSAIQKGNKVEPLLLHLEKNELRWFRHLHSPEQSNVWTFLARHLVWALEANFSVPLSFTSPFIECPTTIPHSSLPVPQSCWKHPVQWEFLCVTHNMSRCSPPVSTFWQCLFFSYLGTMTPAITLISMITLSPILPFNPKPSPETAILVIALLAPEAMFSDIWIVNLEIASSILGWPVLSLSRDCMFCVC